MTPPPIENLNDRRSERRLLRRMAAGEESAFDVFCDEYIPILYRFVLSRLRGDADLAEEIVQTTLAKVIAKLGGFRGRSALSTWLCACARNEIAAHFRRGGRNGREVEMPERELAADSALFAVAGDGPESGLLRREGADLVHRALDALPPHYGYALEWKYLDRISVREIASRLDVGPKAAESLLTRARSAFREAYEGLLDGGGREPGRGASTHPRMAV